MAVIEINEAFASVVLQTLADTGQHARWEAGDVNPNGGGISLGHPLGATGARITATLLAELERRDARYGLATHVHRPGPGDRRRDRALLVGALVFRRDGRRGEPEAVFAALVSSRPGRVAGERDSLP